MTTKMLSGADSGGGLGATGWEIEAGAAVGSAIALRCFVAVASLGGLRVVGWKRRELRSSRVCRRKVEACQAV